MPSQLPSGIAEIIGVERVDSSSRANAAKSITDNGVAGRNISIGGSAKRRGSKRLRKTCRRLQDAARYDEELDRFESK